jgi:hypothetical protein
MTQNTVITDDQWNAFQEQGYLSLGKVLSDEQLSALQARIDAIMLGTADVPYDKLLMQLDSKSGAYSDAGAQTNGHKGATLDYRKIQELEHDPLFLAFMSRPVFREACRREYGDTAVSSFRAMFMNKPANRGTFLPWHQDRWASLDRDPRLTAWTALDPATKENGCVQIIPGSHKRGLLNPKHAAGFLDEEHVDEQVSKDKVVYCEAEPGETILMHNWLLHASDVNRSETSRRAFSVCYMEAQTKDKSGRSYPVIFE